MQYNNLIEAFDLTAQAKLNDVCFRFVEQGHWISLSWTEVRNHIMRLTGGLKALGVKKGDRICILSKTRYEWTLIDMAILASGGIVVPIYESSTPDQIHYIMSNSGAKIIFVENQPQFSKINSFISKLPDLQQIITIEEVQTGQQKDGIYNFEELKILGSENGKAVYTDAIQTLRPTDTASFVYTSGTTGDPKGVILTQGNFLAGILGVDKILPLQKHFENLLFLPLAHIFARVLQYLQLQYGFVSCYAESIDKLLDNVAQVRPHFFASVPRIFEKVYSKTLQNLEGASAAKKKIFEWALAVGTEKSRYVANQQEVPVLLNIKTKLAHKLVYSKLHQKLGGRVHFFVSGGAPLSKEIADFFNAFGFKIIEGYGLTETTATISANTETEFKNGTVGKPFPGAEFKIAADGEILVKGPMVFEGYYKNPEATQQAFTPDGFFQTGDIGEFDAEGFLKITDRKKDIIVTAGGKNIAPQNIENIMKNDPYVSQFIVHGDNRKFLSALVTLNCEEIEKYAKSKNIPYANYKDLVANEKIYNFIRQRIEEKNKQLAKYESIKKFAILPEDFSIESGELTPTLKIKRKVVNKNYAHILDAFYAE